MSKEEKWARLFLFLIRRTAEFSTVPGVEGFVEELAVGLASSDQRHFGTEPSAGHIACALLSALTAEVGDGELFEFPEPESLFCENEGERWKAA